MANHEDIWLDLGTPLEQSDAEIARGAPAILKGAQEFALWLHNPMTEAFFAFLADQEANFTEALTELFIRGLIEDAAAREDKNPQVWRGRILTLRDLRRIGLEGIADFYRQKRGAEEAGSQ